MSSNRFFLLFCILCLYQVQLFSQYLLAKDTSSRSIYSKPYFGEPLYRLTPNLEVENKIIALCEADSFPVNFEIIPANVTTVAVVRDGNKRCLLYDPVFFWANHNEPATQYFLLAHAVALLADTNSLRLHKRIFEEVSADEKAGKLLHHIHLNTGLSFESFKSALITQPYGYADVPLEIRIEAFKRGWAIADGLLNLKDNAGFYLNETDINKLPIPTFWLDGSPSTYQDRENILNRLFNPQSTPKLRDVNKALRKALFNAGFEEWSYHMVNDGFAIITQVEQFEDNGSEAPPGVPGNDRWRDTPPENNINSIYKFLLEYFWPRNGYFRFFVFVVSNKPIPYQKTDVKIDHKYVHDLLSGKPGDLIDPVANLDYVEGYSVNILVYEFYVPPSTLCGTEKSPPKYAPQKHLEGSGILRNLRGMIRS